MVCARCWWIFWLQFTTGKLQLGSKRLQLRNTLCTVWARQCLCRLVNSLSIILQKDLIKSPFHHIYIYICMCIFTARIMTIQPCIITCIFTAWLHIIYCIYFHYMYPMYITWLRIPGVALRLSQTLSRCWQKQTAAGLTTDADTCTETTESHGGPRVGQSMLRGVSPTTVLC